MKTVNNSRSSRILSLVLALTISVMACLTSFPMTAVHTHAAESGTVAQETPATPIFSASGMETTPTAPYIYEGVATSDGTLHVVTGPDKTSAFVVDIYNADGTIKIEGVQQNQGDTLFGWVKDFEILAGEKYVIEAYARSAYTAVEGVVDLTVTFTPKAETPKVDHKLSSVYNDSNPLSAGVHTVNLEEGANNTLFVFSPDEIGVYTFSVSEENIIGYWGAGTFYVKNPNSTSCLISVEIKAVGQSAVIGIASSTPTVELSIIKTGESSGIIETPYVSYENKHTPVAGTYPVSGYQLGYVNIKETHDAVLGADGLYHLDSADGPVLYIDLKNSGFEIDAAFGQYGATTLKGWWNNTYYDFKPAMQSYYNAVKDSGYNYYLTEDLIALFKAYGTNAGWYNPDVSLFTAIAKNETTGEYPVFNADTAWMVSCFVAIGDSAENPIENKITAAATSSYDHKAGIPIYYKLQNTAGQDIKFVADSSTTSFKVMYNGITYEVVGTEFTLTGVSANAVVGIDGAGWFTVTSAASQGTSHTHEIANLTKVDAVAPTHTANGTIEYYTCADCSLIFNANGEQITGSITVPATGHVGATKHDKKDATCTVNGTIEYYTCAECGKNYRGTDAAAEELTDADLVIESFHVWGEPVEVGATCSAEGAKTTYCTVCDVILKVEKIPYAKHTEATRTTSSTCTVKGSVETYCSVCNIVTNKSLLPLADHDYDENDTCTVCGDVKHTCNFVAGEVVAPTCTKGGYTVYTCDSCDATENRDATAALGHTAGNPVVVESTCTKSGSSTTYCTTCNNVVINKALPLAAHSPTTPVTVAPTCTQQGSETTNCSVCGKVVGTKILATVDHKYVNGECSVCGAAEPEAPAADAFTKITSASELKAGDEITIVYYNVAMGNYAFGTTSNTANDKFSGSRITLSLDGNSIDNEYTSFTNIQVFVLETAENGSFLLKCTKGFMEGKYLYADSWMTGTDDAALATRWVFNVSGTQFKISNDAGTKGISVLGAGFFRVSATAGAMDIYRKPGAPAVEAHDHVLSEMNKVDGVPATHTSNGNIEYYTCDKCDVILDEYGEEITLEETVLLASGHMTATKVNGVPATHTTNGNIEYYYCSICAANFTGRAPEAEMIPEGEETLFAMGHTNAEKVNANPATCFANGNIEYYLCSTCNANFVGRAPEAEMIPEGEEVILSMGHNRAEKIDAVAPTCTEDGSIEYYHCNVCNGNYADRAPGAVALTEEDITVSKTGHNFVDGACSVCGEPSHEHILSEMNKVEGVSATHTANGNWEYYTCDKCNVILDAYGEEFPSLEATVILTSGHGRDIMPVEAKEATCTENGNILYYYCSTCKKAYDNGKSPYANELTEEDYTIPATGHKYASGYCTVCNEADPDYVAPANPEFVQTSAGELKAGDEIIIVYNYTNIAMGTSTIKALSSALNGTANLAGTAVTVNGTKLEDITDAVVILVLEEAENGFYLKDKSTGKYLAVDSTSSPAKLIFNATANTAWNIGDSTSTGKLTFSVNGGSYHLGALAAGNFKAASAATALFVYKSSAAGAAECDHNMVQTAFVAATCLTQSETTYTCSKCGKTEVVRGNEIIGHKNSPVQTLAPTCTEEGYDYRKCTVCGEIQITPNTTVAPLGHDNVFTENKPATHTENGNWAYYTCQTCGTITDELGDVVESADLLVINSQGHNRANHFVAVAPTCTEAGNVEYYYCSVCDKNYNGNTYDANEITDVVIPATGHSFDNGVCTVCNIDKAVADFEALVTSKDFGFKYEGETVTEATLRFYMTLDEELYNKLVAMGAVFGIEASCTMNGNTATNSMFDAAYQPVQRADGSYNFALVFTGIKSFYNAELSARVFVEIDGTRYYMQSTDSTTIADYAAEVLAGDNDYTQAQKDAILALGTN